MPRTKTIGNINFVIKQWLEQKQGFAGTPSKSGGRRSYFRNGETTHTGRQFFFKERTIYSYGDHFPIARILDDGCILFTGESYSVTTAGHKRAVYDACRKHNRPIFTVSNPEHSPDSTYLREHYIDLFEKTMRMRTGMCGWKSNHMWAARREYRAFCAHFSTAIEYEPTAEQWRAFALRYKKYYTFVHVMQPIADRLRGKHEAGKR